MTKVRNGREAEFRRQLDANTARMSAHYDTFKKTVGKLGTAINQGSIETIDEVLTELDTLLSGFDTMMDERSDVYKRRGRRKPGAEAEEKTGEEE